MKITDAQIKKIVKVIPVVDTLPADMLTPIAVYLKLSANSHNSFLLESVEGGASLARYSFIGTDPYEVVIGGKDAFAKLRTHFSEYTAAGAIRPPVPNSLKNVRVAKIAIVFSPAMTCGVMSNEAA